jgi:hypothetical protein
MRPANQKDMDKWTKIQDWANENSKLLIMVADPGTDEIYITYDKFSTFVKFPMEHKDEGVVLNALRDSKFKEAISPLVEGVVKCTGMDPMKSKGANELLKVVGGAIKQIGTAKAEEGRRLLNNFLKKDHGKTKKNSRRRK